MTVHQQALTVVARLRDERAGALDALLKASRKAMQAALRDVGTLHFARFVVLPPATSGDEHLLVIETNFDGELAPHLGELWRSAGHLLEPCLAHCQGWQGPGDVERFRRFIAEHGERARAFYAGHAGLSVARIRADARLRRAIDDFLDRRSGDFAGEPSLLVARALQRHVRELARQGAGFDLAALERGPSSDQGGFSAVALRYPFELALRVLLGLGLELWDWLQARLNPPELDTPEIRARLDEIGRHQDRLDQNGLTHVVPIKAGSLRMATLKLALRIVQELGERSGRPAELETMHFARWLILDDGRLLFFSSYDGSFEAYLGDLVDGAAAGLNMIWSNTLHFPSTFGLFFAGARDEERFRRWTRAYQLPTPIWYSAYPSLSVREVLANAAIREILARELDEGSAVRLCRLV